MKRIYQCLILGDKNYNVLVPAFPGFFSFGETNEEALMNATQGLEFHINGLLEDGEDLPIEATQAQCAEMLEDCKDDIVQYGILNIDIPEVTPERINITLPKYLLRNIDYSAKLKGKTRSGFIAEAALSYLKH